MHSGVSASHVRWIAIRRPGGTGAGSDVESDDDHHSHFVSEVGERHGDFPLICEPIQDRQ